MPDIQRGSSSTIAEMKGEVLGSVAQPEPVEWSHSEPLPLIYLPLPLNTLYIAMFGMMHYLASMAISTICSTYVPVCNDIHVCGDLVTCGQLSWVGARGDSPL